MQLDPDYIGRTALGAAPSVNISFVRSGGAGWGGDTLLLGLKYLGNERRPRLASLLPMPRLSTLTLIHWMHHARTGHPSSLASLGWDASPLLENQR